MLANHIKDIVEHQHVEIQKFKVLLCPIFCGYQLHKTHTAWVLKPQKRNL